MSNLPQFAAPYSLEAEEAVLGAALVNPEALDGLLTFLTPDDFYLLRHQYVWEAFTRLLRDQLVIDFVTVTDELARMNRLNDIGGAPYLLHLTNAAPNSMSAETYGRLVQRAAVRRRLLACADEFKALALDEEISLEKVLGDAEKRFMRVRDASLEDSQNTFREAINDLMADVELRMIDPDRPTGILTGYRAFDELTGGLHGPDLTIIAARPGMGKTALMLNMALNAAKLGAHIGIASQEMDRRQIVTRFAAMEADVDSRKVERGRLDAHEYERFVRACGILGKLPIFVDDANGLTPMKLRARCLRWRNQSGLDAVFVDYLQIMSSGGQFRANDRTAEVGYFARELKQLARELRIPVVAAAQLSRSLESRQDKRPILSDLRESGEIEQEADLVHFIYREALYDENTQFPNRAEIITAKYRNGPTGMLELHFERRTTKFLGAS